MKKANNVILSLIIILAGFSIYCYWDGLNGPWIFDDVSHLFPLAESKVSIVNWHEFILNKSGPLKRPVSMASFIANAWVSGDKLWWWKFTNLIIHILTGISIFWLSRRLLSKINNKIKNPPLVAIVIMGIWLLHPLHVSTVLYTVQRMAQLSALFVFLSLAAYVTARQRQLAGEKFQIFFILAYLVFMPLGILSKENALLIPIYILLIEIIFYNFKQGNNQPPSKVLKWIIYSPLILGITILFLFFDSLIVEKYIIRDFTLHERVLTEARVLLAYIVQIVFPVQKFMGFLHDDIILSTHLFDPPVTFISIIGIIFLLAISWLVRKRYTLFSFGIFFFFSAHLMESTVFPLELMFEHRNYIASYGVIFALTALFLEIKLQQNVKAIVVTIIIIMLGYYTNLRVDTWSSAGSLYDYVYKTHPKSKRITIVKARQLAESGQYDQARQALSNFDGWGIYFQELNILCQEYGVIEDKKFIFPAMKVNVIDMYAINEIKTFMENGLEGRCNFSNEKFISGLDNVLNQPIYDKFEGHKLFILKADYFKRGNRYEEAYASLERAAGMVPWDPVPLYIAAEWSIEANDMARAKKYYEMAIMKSNMNIDIHAKLAVSIKNKIPNI